MAGDGGWYTQMLLWGVSLETSRCRLSSGRWPRRRGSLWPGRTWPAEWPAKTSFPSCGEARSLQGSQHDEREDRAPAAFL